VGAFELLMAFYREEARHKNERWSDTQIATWIIEDNIHGIDIDPRAVQIAAAALTLAARNACGERLEVSRINLVAPTLRLASLPEDDDAIVELKATIHQETGLAPELTQRLLTALEGADHLGTLLRIDEAITDVLKEHMGDGQIGLFDGGGSVGLEETSDAMREAILSHIDGFLAKHAASDDLGLRLRGEMLATGVRFLELMKEDHYDVVVGNPPYQGTSKMKEKNYFKKHYPRGKADLYACFLERGLELAKHGGIFAQVSMNGWMFTKQYESLRKHVLDNFHISSLVDLMWCAFENMRHNTVAMYCVRKMCLDNVASIGLTPTPREEREESIPALNRKRASVLLQLSRSEFQTDELKDIEGWPLVYWWSSDVINLFHENETFGDSAPARQGMATSDNTRFLRKPWEINSANILLVKTDEDFTYQHFFKWVPYIKGADGKAWFESLSNILNWKYSGIEIREYSRSVIRNEDFYFERGIAFNAIGNNISSRMHYYRSIFDVMGQSSFPENALNALLSSNSPDAKYILHSLNPTIHIQVGDINRLPIFEVPFADKIFSHLLAAFENEALINETSVLFKKPGPSRWESICQKTTSTLENYECEDIDADFASAEITHVREVDFISWGVGVALGRFDKEEGLVEEVPEGALPAGILFLSEATEEDSLEHEACELLKEQWEEHGAAINKANSTKSKEDLRTWLRNRFFADVHRQMYENAPIYFPLSSAKKSFVAYVSIHRWDADTLRILQADHLLPERQRIEGRIDDLRATPEEERNRQDQKQLDNLLSFLDELEDFITLVEQCAEQGPPAPDSKTPEREVDARYEPVLDDGTMINAAGLWPLLDPQWNHPQKWWKSLADESGFRGKDYDWSKLAARYFPTRVDEKCKEDPSLAVAHGCFWKYHPERAYAWELRLQHEIEEDFTLDEEDSDDLRDAFLVNNPDKAEEIREAEFERRLKVAKKNGDDVEEEQLRQQLNFSGNQPVESFAKIQDRLPNELIEFIEEDWGSQADDLYCLIYKLLKSHEFRSTEQLGLRQIMDINTSNLAESDFLSKLFYLCGSRVELLSVRVAAINEDDSLSVFDMEESKKIFRSLSKVEKGKGIYTKDGKTYSTSELTLSFEVTNALAEMRSTLGEKI
jgi:16S rRNA G966 N2-methylase RsmD